MISSRKNNGAVERIGRRTGSRLSTTNSRNESSARRGFRSRAPPPQCALRLLEPAVEPCECSLWPPYYPGTTQATGSPATLALRRGALPRFIFSVRPPDPSPLAASDSSTYCPARTTRARHRRRTTAPAGVPPPNRARLRRLDLPDIAGEDDRRDRGQQSRKRPRCSWRRGHSNACHSRRCDAGGLYRHARVTMVVEGAVEDPVFAAESLPLPPRTIAADPAPTRK